MSLTLGEIEAVSNDYCDKTSTDIYHKANILLHQLLKKGKTIGGGLKIRVPLEYASPTAVDYAADTTLSSSKEAILNAARFDWASYAAPIVYDLDDTLENSGEAALVNIVSTKIKAAQKAIRTLMGSDIYLARSAGSNSRSFNGLADLFDSSFAYGGILESDMGKWATPTIATSEVISFTVMQSIRAAALVDNNNEGVPNLYIGTQALKDAFEASLTQNARYTDAALAKAGFDNIKFGNQPFVADNKISSGVFGLNLRYLDILAHKDRNFTRPKWTSPVGLPDKFIAYITWAGNLVCKNRAAHCHHSGVTAS